MQDRSARGKPKMIKYVELTPPEASAFRQAKILSIECQEGSQIKEGDTLFRVQSGAHEINLPATKAGRVIELIVGLHERITLSSALLLLETEIGESTTSMPINVDDDSAEAARSNNNSVADISIRDTESTEIESADDRRRPTEQQVLAQQEVQRDVERLSKRLATSKRASKDAETAEKKQQQMATKKHQQQLLDLKAGDLFESKDSTKQLNADNNEVVLTQIAVPTSASVKNHSQPSLTMTSSSIIEVTVPDIGADSAKVIEILVNVGDAISIEDPLITLESDKASMDVPSPHDGVVKTISVSLDQDISEGTLILELEAEQSEPESKQSEPESKQSEPKPKKPEPKPKKSQSSDEKAADKQTDAAAKEADSEPTEQTVEVRIPDIGGDSAKVIEVLVAIGDRVDVEDSLLTLESDKASMDVPSSVAGIVKSIEVSVDQDVSEGTTVVTVAVTEPETTTATSTSSEEATSKATNSTASSTTKVDSSASEKSPTKSAPADESNNSSAIADKQHDAGSAKSHASPSIRRFARELGVELANIKGSGRKARITHEDVKGFVKDALNKPAQSAHATVSRAGIPEVPAQDFSKFGEIDIQPLNKIKRLTAENLHRSWLNVPHVTHNDEANISDLESFRKQLNSEYQQQKRDIKLSPLAFIVKAVVHGLQLYPQFNSSLEPGGENLIYKKYVNIGIAVETPNGLVVPVLKDADKKSIVEIAKEMGELAKKARDKKLTMKDMSGACITISSLGGIGGTGFTPIVNAPEVAILGVSRSKVQPVWNGSDFEPGMMLPLSLSYDHRVIDGAEAARFTRHIAAVLEDVRRLTV
ncbi:MAG: pyruvate dehydrogenase E2 component (dihydrolipoamide acetyltransferase) [Arenicella sp.]|jgi:pyruvate dehydrogenase E2 component (dihydrolipoamide acetyltransferase)